MGTAIVLLLLAGAIGLVIRSMVKGKKARRVLHCGGDCKHCGGSCR